MRVAVFPTSFKMLQPVPSIFFQYNNIILKIHVIVLHFESIVNYAQSTKLLRDTAECTTNENAITRPYHLS